MYMQAVDAKKVTGNLSSLSSTFLNIGRLKAELGEFDEARNFYDKSLEINLKDNNKRSIALNYQNLGQLLLKADSLEEALLFFNQSFEINQELNNRGASADMLNEIGNVLLNQHKHRDALSAFTRALRIKKEIENKNGVCFSNLNMAKAYFEMKEYSLALMHADISLSLAQELGQKKAIVDASELIYQTYKLTDNSKAAMMYLEMNKNYSDSLLDEVKLKELASIESKFILNQITNENELLQKENAIKNFELERSEAQISNQRTILIFSILALFLTFFATYFIYKLYLSKNRDHKQLELLNAKMTSQKNQLESQAVELQKANNDITLFNEALELAIKERTEKIKEQNERLQQYAFANSHEVRAPLARLMGLADQWKKEETTEEQRLAMNAMIELSARELDEVIRKNHKLLATVEEGASRET